MTLTKNKTGPYEILLIKYTRRKKYMGCLKHTHKNNHIKINIKLTFNILNVYDNPEMKKDKLHRAFYFRFVCVGFIFYLLAQESST